MKIRVLFFASARDRVGRREVDWELPEGSRVADFKRELVARYPAMAPVQRTLSIAVNAECAGDAVLLQPGDEVAVIPPVSGGGVFAITEEPIAPDALFKTVLRDYHGAVVTFCGVVRNHSGSRRTHHLFYEAYREMAEKRMAEIAAEVEQKWGIREVAILHRVGRLEVGEISALVAVASPHRQQAFEACRYVIDRLKEVVPIWKKEVGEEGEVWVEG